MIAFLLQACQSDSKKNIPDVSDLEVDFEIRRFEQALFALDTNQMATELETLQANYPDFSAIFFDQLLGSTDPRIAPIPCSVSPW